MKKYAKLRVCASCEWVFKSPSPEAPDCPKCDFVSYGARYVYGNAAYKYEKTQQPWMDKKMGDYRFQLTQEISASKPPKAVPVIMERFGK